MNGFKQTVEWEKTVAIEDKCSKIRSLKRSFLTLLKSKDSKES